MNMNSDCTGGPRSACGIQETLASPSGEPVPPRFIPLISNTKKIEFKGKVCLSVRMN
ncbi:MAG: hypothetical protein ACFE0J_02815 [Elainellaceae cyanobacterium]